MHEPLAEAFMTTAMHLFEGEQERIEAINVKADQDICDVNRMALDAIRRLDDGSGVLVLTDILGELLPTVVISSAWNIVCR